MSIYDDLFKNFVASSFNTEAGNSFESFSSVEDKVESIRKRVALEVVEKQVKSASIIATAAPQRKIVLFKKANEKNEESEKQQIFTELKSYLMQLIDQRKAGVEITAAFYELREKFPEQVEFIRDHKDELLDFAKKYQAKYKSERLAPSPTRSDIFDVEEDKKTFENIADKL